VAGGSRDLESYDPEAREWTRHAPMAAARFSPAFAVYGERLWVLGGNGLASQLYTTEIYDPTRDRWSRGPDLPRRMGWFAALPLEGGLLIAGGLYFDQKREKYHFFQDAYLLKPQPG